MSKPLSITQCQMCAVCYQSFCLLTQSGIRYPKISLLKLQVFVEEYIEFLERFSGYHLSLQIVKVLCLALLVCGKSFL